MYKMDETTKRGNIVLLISFLLFMIFMVLLILYYDNPEKRLMFGIKKDIINFCNEKEYTYRNYLEGENYLVIVCNDSNLHYFDIDPNNIDVDEKNYDIYRSLLPSYPIVTD